MYNKYFLYSILSKDSKLMYIIYYSLFHYSNSSSRILLIQIYLRVRRLASTEFARLQIIVATIFAAHFSHRKRRFIYARS